MSERAISFGFGIAVSSFVFLSIIGALLTLWPADDESVCSQFELVPPSEVATLRTEPL